MITQLKRPWRSTVRTVFQALVGFASMWAILVQVAGLDSTTGWVSASLAVTAAVTRVMALPQVEAFLQRFLPWLAADPATPPVDDPAGHEFLGDGDLSGGLQ